MMRSYATLLAAMLLGSIWWGPAGAATAATQPPPKGSIILFSGWIWPIFDSTAGTGIEDMSNSLKAIGIKTEIDNPDYWQTAVERFAASYDPAAPVAVVGYSLGANAAVLFSQKLEERGIPVQSLVLIEATQPNQIPSNVVHAVQFYVSGMAIPIRPGPGFEGSLRNVNLAERRPGAGDLNHWSVSHYKEMQDAVLAEILDGNRVRTWNSAQAKQPSRYTSGPARRHPRKKPAKPAGQ